MMTFRSGRMLLISRPAIRYSLLLFAALLLSSASHAQKTWTLQDCIRKTTESNPAVAVQENGAAIASINLEQAKMQRLPSVNISVNQGINTGRSIDPFTNLYITNTTGTGNYGIYAQLVLFNGMQLTNTIRRNRALLQSSQQLTETAKNNQVIQTIAAYITVISNGEVEKTLQLQLTNTNAQLAAGKEKVKAGVMGENQLADLYALVETENLDLQNARYALEQSKLALFLLMNETPDTTVRFSPLELKTNLPPASSLDAAVLYQQALKHFPDVRSVEEQKKAAEFDVRIARGLRAPALSLFSSINSNYSSSAPATLFEPDGTTTAVTTTSATDYVTVSGTDYYIKQVQQVQNGTEKPFGFMNQVNFNKGYNIGVSLRIPILNGFQVKYRVQTARANLNLLNKQQQSSQTGLQNAIQQAVSNYANTEKRIAILERLKNAHGQTTRNASIRLEAGVGSFYDYTLSKTNEDKTLVNLIQAKYEQAFRWTILNFYATGTWE